MRLRGNQHQALSFLQSGRVCSQAQATTLLTYYNCYMCAVYGRRIGRSSEVEQESAPADDEKEQLCTKEEVQGRGDTGAETSSQAQTDKTENNIEQLKQTKSQNKRTPSRSVEYISRPRFVKNSLLAECISNSFRRCILAEPKGSSP